MIDSHLARSCQWTKSAHSVTDTFEDMIFCFFCVLSSTSVIWTGLVMIVIIKRKSLHPEDNNLKTLRVTNIETYYSVKFQVE